MRIHALDLSLTATGHARMLSPTEIFHETISPPKGCVGIERIDWIANQITSRVNDAFTPLLIFENFSFASNDAGSHERIGLAYMLRHWAWRRGIPFVLVAPSQLKKFVTGKGNAEKSLILREVFRRWNIAAANDNEADGITLLQIGRCLVGDMEPETQPQREVIAALHASGAVPKGFREAVTA